LRISNFAAAAKVKTHPTRSHPRNIVCSCPATGLDPAEGFFDPLANALPVEHPANVQAPAKGAPGDIFRQFLN
jgi:hypothetical protein